MMIWSTYASYKEALELALEVLREKEDGEVACRYGAAINGQGKQFDEGMMQLGREQSKIISLR